MGEPRHPHGIVSCARDNPFIGINAADCRQWSIKGSIIKPLPTAVFFHDVKSRDTMCWRIMRFCLVGFRA